MDKKNQKDNIDESSQQLNSQKKIFGLDPGVCVAGFCLSAGIVAGNISHNADVLDGKQSLEILTLSLCATYAVSTAYLLMGQESRKTKIDYLKRNTINLSLATAGYLGSYFGCYFL